MAGIPIDEYSELTGNILDENDHNTSLRQVRDAASEVIERKDATYYAVGLAVCRICRAILKNQHSILTVSSYIEELYGVSDVCLSLPAIAVRRA